MVAISDFSTFSQMTGMRLGYFWRMRSASACRDSVAVEGGGQHRRVTREGHEGGS